MNDKLITMPDSDFIAEFAESLKTANSRPESLYVDGHVDLPWFMGGHASDKIFDNLESGPVTPETVKESGVRLFTTSIYCQDIYNGEKALKHFQQNYDFAQKILENLTHVKSNWDIDEIKGNEDAIGTLFLLENADALTGNNSLMLSLRERGIYFVGLTHAGTNRLADGDSVIHSDGITSEGREVIHVLQDNNILIDVAHLHPSCFWQLMDLIDTSCVSSHTGIKGRCNIPRNLNMEQVRQISDRGGLIGITFNPNMLSADGEADMEDIFIHIDTVVQKIGPDYVALGSDFCGFITYVEGMEDFTGVTGLIKIMKAHGYQGEAIDKIMGQNWLRIYKKLL